MDQDVNKIESYKANLSDKERAALGKQAESELQKSGESKKAFITDALIAAKRE